MIKNKTTLNSMTFFLSAFLSTSFIASLQASEVVEEHPPIASSSTAQVTSEEIFINTQNPLIKDASDSLLVEIVKGQEMVKEALRGALEKKLESNYKPIDILKGQARDIGLDADALSTETLNAYFQTTFQSKIITSYLKKTIIEKTDNDYYEEERGKNRVRISWTRRDTQNIHTIFDTLPLEQWSAMLVGDGIHQIPLLQNINHTQNNDYLMGMKNANDIRQRGVAYLQALHTFTLSKRNEYKRMTFGK